MYVHRYWVGSVARPLFGPATKLVFLHNIVYPTGCETSSKHTQSVLIGQQQLDHSVFQSDILDP